ncbi:LCP family protein [Micromonospora polyrhachis]|uniref:LCP family protein required for cell wall assembly n=1 Tax=Micromonospora polyrhachis TaxID=1282883 RepID=A0A7W7SQD6_9ACTN|nr:LCP family protein [Micromonospora polyrhachis]MBB4959024.1 LCP family protein required for cell wall assembly [Micromonospora polyrhachis]
MLLSGVTGFGLRALLDRYDRSITKDDLLDPAARRHHANVTGPLNYLLVGSDRRPSSPDSEQRADTIMIAHIPASLDRTYLISIPRDLLVTIPQSTVTGYEGGSDKINAAFQHGGGGQGGTQLLSATLTRLTGLRFDGAALIDFTGFQRVIDLVGGIRMCVDAPVRSIHTKRQFNPGCQQMDGAQALDFARQRYDLPNGDYDRQRHQQQLLKAILDKISTDNLLTNPVKLDQVLRAIGSSITMDTNGVAIEDLIFGLRGMRSDALTGIRVPAYSEMLDGTSFEMLDEGAADLFQSLGGRHVDDWVSSNPKWINQI